MLKLQCHEEITLSFIPKKNKYGYITAAASINIPKKFNKSSLLYLVAELAVRHSKYRASSVIRWLIQNPYVFPEFAKPFPYFTLDKIMSLRCDLHKASVDKRHSFPKTYAASVCNILVLIENPLACGRFVSQWGRYRAETRDKRARQISEDDLVWDQIKLLKSTNDAKEVARRHVNEIFDQYFDAAWIHIQDYQHFMRITKSKVIQGDIKTNSKSVKDTLKDLVNLGFNGNVLGRYRQILSQEWRGTLSPRILISILIICKLRRPLNTDVWLSLSLSNFKKNKTFIEISGVVKGKTNKQIQSFIVVNRDRKFFTALTLLIQHAEVTKSIIARESIQTLREPLVFDYLTYSGLGMGLQITRDYQYLRGRGFQRFQEENGLPALTLETLRNLTATKRFLNGSDLRDIQQLLGHSELSTTQHYIDQNITSSFLKHNVLTFMRELEQAAFDLFDSERVTSDSDAARYLERYFLIGDGSSCANPKDSPDQNQTFGDICNGKYCHNGCENNKIILSEQAIWQALVKREEHRTGWFKTHYHQEKFGAFEANKVIYNALLCQFIADKLPRIYSEMMEKITNRIEAKELL